MKKVSALISAFLISVIAFASIGLYINSQSDKVSVIRKDIFGDAAYAEGLSVSQRVIMSNKLLWQTSYDVLSEEAKTDFTYYNNGKKSEFAVSPYDRYAINMNVASNFGMATSGGSIEFDSHDDLMGFGEMVYEIYQNTPKEEGTYVTRVNLKDYYDFYPINSDSYGMFYEFEYKGEILKDYNYTSEGSESISAALNEYFKIPVGENCLLDVEITIDRDGYPVGLNVNTVEGSEIFYMDSSSFSVENGCFIVFNNTDNKGNTVDLSYISGGYGIYFMPIEKLDNGYLRAKTEHIKVVYSVDEHDTICKMDISENEKEIYLITAESGYYYLTVLSFEDFSVIDRVKLFEYDEIYDLCDREYHEDYIVVYASDESFYVYDRTDEGKVEFAFSSSLADVSGNNDVYYQKFDTYSIKTAYDGNRLALMDYAQATNGYLDPTFRLAVYDKNGLCYYGEFDTSLNEPKAGADSMRLQYYHTEPFNIKFNED